MWSQDQQKCIYWISATSFAFDAEIHPRVQVSLHQARDDFFPFPVELSLATNGRQSDFLMIIVLHPSESGGLYHQIAMVPSKQKSKTDNT